MSKKNKRSTRVKQRDFDLKREKEYQQKSETNLLARKHHMKVDSGKIQKKKLKIGSKRRFKLKVAALEKAKAKAKAAQAMELDS